MQAVQGQGRAEGFLYGARISLFQGCAFAELAGVLSGGKAVLPLDG